MIKGISVSSGLAGALTTGLAFTFGLLPVPQGDAKYEGLRALAEHVTVEYVDDHAGGLAKTLRFTGVNVQIVNGLDATNGDPSSPFATRGGVQTNSVGNLILGYNESSPRRSPRTGSHNFVVGPDHGFESFGGVVTGYKNTSRGPYSVGLSGEGHKTVGAFSVAVGGEGHLTSGIHSVATGGFQNQVSGLNCFSGGGRHSQISGSHAKSTGELGTVVGGTKNESRGMQSVASGGFRNLASGWRATVNGGENNVASGDHSSVAFGHNRTVTKANTSGNTEHDGVAGSLWEDK
jgi:hypothetical protein